MQIIIKLQVDSKLDKETTKQLINDAVHKWLSDNNSVIPVAQDHDYDDEELIKVGEIIVN